MTTIQSDNEQVQQEATAQDQQQPQAAQAESTPAAAETPIQSDPKKKSAGRELLEWVLYLGAAVLVALAIRTFIFEPVRVDGASMSDTLHDGEVMIVTKPEYVFGGNPQRNDVVICHYPQRGATNFVKRVVGLPGDVVEIKDGYLYINNEQQPEEFLTHRPNYEMPAYTVPEGKYFVLGDNRSNSNDSHLVGPLDRNMIVGHVRWVVFPFGQIRTVE